MVCYHHLFDAKATFVTIATIILLELYFIFELIIICTGTLRQYFKINC